MDGGVDAELPAPHFPEFLFWDKQWDVQPQKRN